jgi:hypothetical protein
MRISFRGTQVFHPFHRFIIQMIIVGSSGRRRTRTHVDNNTVITTASFTFQVPVIVVVVVCCFSFGLYDVVVKQRDSAS